MVAWLRTGLDALESVPRGHLFASCERVLRVRMEVTEAVREKLSAVRPDKLEQYQLLLEEDRSVQRLMDQTLGDAKRVTAANAEELLEEMRLATAEEVSQEYERKLAKTRAATFAVTKEMQAKIESMHAAHSDIQAKAAASLIEQINRVADLEREKAAELSKILGRVDNVILSINRTLLQIDRGALVLMWLIAAGGGAGLLERSITATVIGGLAGLAGLTTSFKISAKSRSWVWRGSLISWASGYFGGGLFIWDLTSTQSQRMWWLSTENFFAARQMCQRFLPRTSTNWHQLTRIECLPQKL